jgi:hypothetical protein
MFKCLECGRKFRTALAAERAASDGCQKCGGVDIDLDPDARPLPSSRVQPKTAADPDTFDGKGIAKLP